MSEEHDAYIMTFNSPLSNKAIYVKVPEDNLNVSVDRLVNDTIQELRATGKPLEADQLNQLYKDHQLFGGEHGTELIEKGDLFSRLWKKQSIVNNIQYICQCLDSF